MHNHAPTDYTCPICLGVEGIENDKTLLLQQDIIYQDKICTAFINSFWITGSEGHVIVVPNEHFENIYDLPEVLAGHVQTIAKKVALAMKQVYKCDGITTLQNNEPAGSQHAFHYHLHIFPRYANDSLFANMGNKQLAAPSDRLVYAGKLRGLMIIYN